MSSDCRVVPSSCDAPTQPPLAQSAAMTAAATWATRVMSTCCDVAGGVGGPGSCWLLGSLGNGAPCGVGSCCGPFVKGNQSYDCCNGERQDTHPLRVPGCWFGLGCHATPIQHERVFCDIRISCAEEPLDVYCKVVRCALLLGAKSHTVRW